jgi:hypothetical protein
MDGTKLAEGIRLNRPSTFFTKKKKEKKRKIKEREKGKSGINKNESIRGNVSRNIDTSEICT